MRASDKTFHRALARLATAQAKAGDNADRSEIAADAQRLVEDGPDKPWLDPGSPGHLAGLPDNVQRPGLADETSGDGFFYALIHKP